MVTFGTPADINGSTGPIAVHEITNQSAAVWQAQITLPGGNVSQGDPMQSIGGEMPYGR